MGYHPISIISDNPETLFSVSFVPTDMLFYLYSPKWDTKKSVSSVAFVHPTVLS